LLLALTLMLMLMLLHKICASYFLSHAKK